MMKISNRLTLFSILLFSGLFVDALVYDYSYSIECLETPFKAQYGGGIIKNPEMNEGLRGWSTFGDAKLQLKESATNKFIVAHSRTQPFDSASQKLYLETNLLYTFSAWIQVSEGSAAVAATFKTSNGYIHAGAVIAESKCWSMLKGGLIANVSGPADLYFESNNTAVEIWVDSISLQPFSKEEWASHQKLSIEKNRKSQVRIQATDRKGNPLANATISIKQNRLGFPVGCAINKNILSNTAYQNWFTQRFTVTTFENEMKWYATEGSGRGHEDYSIPDAMLAFAKQHRVSVRGHNVLWDDPQYQPGWINSLPQKEIFKAVETRVNSIMSRYKNQLIAWDVVNENLHFGFFESKLGKDASGFLYELAGRIDGATTLFMNEYNTIEDGRDGASTPAKYLQKLREIQTYGNNKNLRMGIGLEAHFTTPNIPYIRASIDALGATNLPIWLTEVDVQSGPNQAEYLEEILREAQSHPKVAGIVIWSSISPNGCYRMCLTDNNFKNLPTGDVVDKLLREWGKLKDVKLTANPDGVVRAALYHGDYEIKINHAATVNSSEVHSIKVAPKDNRRSRRSTTLQVQLTA